MVYQEFPPTLLILSPRLSLAGAPGSSVVGINTTELGDGSFVYCVENKSEYQIDKTDNTTPPAGSLVLAPITGPGRWFKRTLETSDHKVFVNGLDTLAGYLAAKVIPGANVTATVVDLGGGNLALSIAATVPPGSSDHKVLVDGADTTAAFLAAKIAAGSNVTLTTLNPGGNEQIELSVEHATPLSHAATHRPASGTDPLATAAPGSIDVGDAAAVGVGDSFARNDHVHGLPAPPAPVDVTKAAAAAGAATTVARSDHKHDVTTAAPATGIGAGNTEGVATTLARSDHNHTIHETGGPTNLTVGAIADGQVVVRVGNALVGGDGLPASTKGATLIHNGTTYVPVLFGTATINGNASQAPTVASGHTFFTDATALTANRSIIPDVTGAGEREAITFVVSVPTSGGGFFYNLTCDITVALSAKKVVQCVFKSGAWQIASIQPYTGNL